MFLKINGSKINLAFINTFINLENVMISEVFKNKTHLFNCDDNVFSCIKIFFFHNMYCHKHPTVEYRLLEPLDFSYIFLTVYVKLSIIRIFLPWNFWNLKNINISFYIINKLININKYYIFTIKSMHVSPIKYLEICYIFSQLNKPLNVVLCMPLLRYFMYAILFMPLNVINMHCRKHPSKEYRLPKLFDFKCFTLNITINISFYFINKLE